MKVVDVLRPAVEGRLADIKACPVTWPGVDWGCSCVVISRSVHVCVCVYLNISKERSIVTIYDVGMGQQDLTDSANFAIMKRYVPMLLCGTTLPNPEIVSCKDHRVGASIYIWQHPYTGLLCPCIYRF